MARIEIDPNYNTPTFSRATAAADIFKKEDVQALAAAVSTHDHSTGKGVVLSAGSIPVGSITSAMIANGTIVAADIATGTITSNEIANGTIQGSDIANGTITDVQIAANSIYSTHIVDGTLLTADMSPNAVTGLLGSYLAAPTFSTTAVSTWTATPITVSVTVTAGSRLRVSVTTNVQMSVAGNYWIAAIVFDANTGAATPIGIGSSGATYMVPLHITQHFTGVTAGAHTITLYLLSAIGGTMSINSGVASSYMAVVEEKR